MSARFAIVVLAGGEGRRIGGGKPLRRLGGETLIARAVRTAEGWSDLVRIAVRGPAQVPWDTIRDDPRIAGPLGGLAAGLRFARTAGRKALLALPCDMPFLPASVPERLAAEIGEECAAVAVSGGEIHPICALWRVEALEGLDSYLATGRRSLRGFAEAVGYAAVEWPTEPFDPFYNVNNEEDLKNAESILAEVGGRWDC